METNTKTRLQDSDPLPDEIRVGYFLTLYYKLLEINTLFFALLSGARRTDKYIVIPRNQETDEAFKHLSGLCGAEQIQQDRFKFRTKKDGTEEPVEPDKAVKDLYG